MLAFLADEEAGGNYGSHWFVDHRPDLFEGVDAAVGEVGGFSFTVRDDLRLYLIETAEKGIAWMKLDCHGRAGHGSMVNHDNAVTNWRRSCAAGQPPIPARHDQDRLRVHGRSSRSPWS